VDLQGIVKELPCTTYVQNNKGEGSELSRPVITSFNIVQRENAWFWCSDVSWEVRGAEALIGPFLSRDEAVADAWEALGIKEREE
jgi:hypothetical protein